MKMKTMQGTVRTLHGDKGFGFIAGSDGREYFFHRSGAEEFAVLQPGDHVQFEAGEGPKGPRAEFVALVPGS